MTAGRQDQNESVKIREICVSARGRLRTAVPTSRQNRNGDIPVPTPLCSFAASREKNAAVKTKRTRRLALPVLRLVSVRLF